MKTVNSVFRKTVCTLAIAFSFTAVSATQGIEKNMTNKVTQTAGRDVLGKFGLFKYFCVI